MANTETLLSSDEKQLAKQYAKRKAFLFAYVLSTIAFLTVYGLESGHALFLVDDYAKTILPVAALIVIGLTWRKDSTAGLKRTNNIGTVIGFLILAVSIMAVVLERGTVSEADDFPGIILGAFLVINGVA
jgi:Mn2+/Fe2+ NRAMP family transporter